MSVSQIHSRKIAKIFVVDDHPLVREGLKAKLAGEVDIEVCGEADCIEQATERIRVERPDLVIIDLVLGRQQGLDLLRRMQANEGHVKTLVLSNYDEMLYAERALRTGAMGYVNKSASWDVVVEAIRTVLGGRRYLSPQMTDRLLNQTLGAKPASAAEADATGSSSPVDVLTDRELEVFRLIGEGRSIAQIARQLFLSTHTIDSHRENIKRKLKLKNRSELMRMAILWILENG